MRRSAQYCQPVEPRKPAVAKPRSGRCHGLLGRSRRRGWRRRRGCSGAPRHAPARSQAAGRRRTGRGPRPHPPPPRPRGHAVTGSQCVGVLGAEDTVLDGLQGPELVAGRGRIPPPPSSGRGWCGRPGCRGARGPLAEGSAASWSRARPHHPPPHSSGRGGNGWPGWPGARGREPARGGAAARRTGRAPWPHPPHPRSSGRGWCRRSTSPGQPQPLSHVTVCSGWPPTRSCHAGNHCSLAKILSIASAPMVITGRIWWR